MPTVSESIQSFLAARANENNLDLVNLWSSDMETQVNVLQADGEAIGGKTSTWSNGIDTWHSIRIPKNADSDASWDDYTLRFPLDVYAHGIGLTGWNWKSGRSIYVAFDFDSITDHAQGIGISDEDLNKVREAAEALPYVEVRKSTGGNGIHFYVYFDGEGIPTENHTEHAALARCVLGMMNDATGFDFASHIDAAGHIMWVWHRKMSLENGGLKIIKKASQKLGIENIASNWKDHVEVVKRQRGKIKVQGVPEGSEDKFEERVNGRTRVPLDDCHKALIDELCRSGYSTAWISDHHLLQTHTMALQEVMTEKKEELGLRGAFSTNSAGRHKEQPNCFGFPLSGGAWRMFRFSPGTSESNYWHQDGEGWTTCIFNKPLDLATAATMCGGMESPEGGFVFEGPDQAKDTLEKLGSELTFPVEFADRQVLLNTAKDGRVVASVKKAARHENAPQGWIDSKGKLVKLTDANGDLLAAPSDEQCDTIDKYIRATSDLNKDLRRWYFKTDLGDWVGAVKDDVRDYVKGKPDLGEDALPKAVANPWRRVSIPFQAEYPGSRQWNACRVQYVHTPATVENEAGHPHWNMILNHCFKDLDEVLPYNTWAVKNGIKTGAQYGLLWMAIVLRAPYTHLPYLFFYGDEECGKSIFHESFDYLITGGRVSAALAFTNSSGYNGELAGAVLAYVDEMDITKSKSALQRLKDWLVAPTLAIRQMRTDQYSIPNTLHFCHTANSPEFCPVMPGDSRITVLHVSPIKQETMVPRDQMKNFLMEEGPQFMRTIMEVELPKMTGRIGIPVIETKNKKLVQSTNTDILQDAWTALCQVKEGAQLDIGLFVEKMHAGLDPTQAGQWPKKRVTSLLMNKHELREVDGVYFATGWELIATKPGHKWMNRGTK